MGCGVVALGRHVPAILQTQGLELHAVFEPDEGRRRRATEDLGIPHGFADPEAFFDSGIEAVSVASPAPFHETNVLAAARHRLPVLCEKPLALDAAGARRMIAAMESAGAPLFTAFCYRFSPSALRIRELVREGGVGEETGESSLLGTAADGLRAIEIARSATDEAMRRRAAAATTAGG